MPKMILRQTLPEPINGYWNGGKKQVFDWEIGKIQQDSKGYFARIGSFSANRWFHVAQGKSDKQTLSYAKKHLQKTVIGKASKFEYILEKGG